MSALDDLQLIYALRESDRIYGDINEGDYRAVFDRLLDKHLQEQPHLAHKEDL